MTFTGWALQPTAQVYAVNVIVDPSAAVGLPTYQATYGLARTDVCAVYTSAYNCPNVGCSAAIDTAQLSNGPHVARVTAYGLKNFQSTITSPFTVSNTNLLIKTYIDQPNSNTAPLSGTATLPVGHLMTMPRSSSSK